MTYHIPKGQHYCIETAVKAHDQSLAYSVRCIPDESWVYNLHDVTLNRQSNKIEGRSFGLDHHQQSARTSWRPETDATGLIPTGRIEFLAYYYNNGRQIAKYLFTCKPGDMVVHGYEFDRVNGFIRWWWTVNTATIKKWKSFAYDWTHAPNWGYELYPYAGGDSPAIHDITVNATRQ